MKLSLIVATSLNWVIGKENGLPWHLPADLREFRKRTMGHHLLMGSHTFHSIGRVLPGRVNMVVSRKMAQSANDNLFILNSIEAAVDLAKYRGESELFIIGGGMIYQETLPKADTIYWTKVHTQAIGDTYFPPLGPEWSMRAQSFFRADKENIYDYEFMVMEKCADKR